MIDAELVDTGLVVTAVHGGPRVAAPPAVPPSPLSAAVAETPRLEGLPERLMTLDASRPGGSYWSVPDVETHYWRPCKELANDGSGPHVFFIASNLILSFYCPACRPRRIVIGDGFSVAAPVAPWGAGAPIWEGLSTAPKLIEWYEERAAIMEHEGGLPKAAAQHQAYQLLVTKLKTAAALAATPGGQRSLFA